MPLDTDKLLNFETDDETDSEATFLSRQTSRDAQFSVDDADDEIDKEVSEILSRKGSVARGIEGHVHEFKAL